MFFVLSKVLSYFTHPLVVIVILLILSLYIKRDTWKRRLWLSAIIMLVFFSNHFIANEAMMLWETKPVPMRLVQDYEIGIVLTGVLVNDPIVNDRVTFTRGADRVYHAVELYKLGKIKRILISGGIGRVIGDAVPEANQLHDAMVVMGVASEDIIIENEARNTRENATESKRIIDDLNITYHDCLLITSAFHMRRSIACFEKAGIPLDYFATDYYSTRRSFDLDELLIPSIDAILIWQKLIKEWVGLMMYKVVGYV